MRFEQITNLQDFGARAIDIDLNQASNTEIGLIHQMLHRYGFIVFEPQKLNEKQFIDFGKKLGKLKIFVDEEYRHPDYPEIFVVSNIKRNNKKFGMDRVGLYWHSDCSFLAEPQAITMLHCQTPPARGGQTSFLDMRALWCDLPFELQQELRCVECEHEGQSKYIITESDVGLSIEEVIKRDLKLVPTVKHPATLTHPYTKTESLYINPGFTSRIINLPESRAKEILSLILKKIELSNFKYMHSWKAQELIIWDNRSLLHKAYRPDDGEDRLLFRIGLSDGQFFGETRWISE